MRYIKLFESFEAQDILVSIKEVLRNLGYENILSLGENDNFDTLKHKVKKSAEDNKKMAILGTIKYDEGLVIACSISKPMNLNSDESYKLESEFKNKIEAINNDVSFYRSDNGKTFNFNIKSY